MKTWQLQEAKDAFCQIVKAAEHGEPQGITRHGEGAAVVISMKEYERLAGRNKTIAALVRSTKYRGRPLEIDRLKDPAREAGL
ncbi:MAG TPA: type II toxin-antitoxin system Phd/YefM family antitoxin [Roseimicrobium sp.]|nr:type II toxin-antitoxin system Phd/YefM family antitoxin [Roseimicrobium sp.]